MIANPKDVAVEVLSGAEVSEEILSITHHTMIGERRLFHLHRLDGLPVAVSLSSRALSRWALERGAKEVAFNFDLRPDP